MARVYLTGLPVEEEDEDVIRQKLLDAMGVADESQYLYPPSCPARLSKDAIRVKVLTIGAPKTQQTVVNMVTVLCRLERWWWLKYNEKRSVENIPAEQLDAYLAEFFTVLVRPDGQEYDTCHVSKVRSNLDRFLRDCGYPYSISKSEIFVASQQAVKNKRQQLNQQKSASFLPAE